MKMVFIAAKFPKKGQVTREGYCINVYKTVEEVTAPDGRVLKDVTCRGNFLPNSPGVIFDFQGDWENTQRGYQLKITSYEVVLLPEKSSIIAYPDITYDDGAALTKVAFSKIPYVGAPLLTFGILTFAFSTILGWSYYGESAVNYIERQKSNRFYRILYIVVLFFGSIINLDIIWNIADCMNALMTIPNLVALLLLSTIAAKETRKYLWSNRLDEEMEE